VQEPSASIESPETLKPLIDEELAAKVRAIPDPEQVTGNGHAAQGAPQPCSHGTRQARGTGGRTQEDEDTDGSLPDEDSYTEEGDTSESDLEKDHRSESGCEVRYHYLWFALFNTWCVCVSTCTVIQ
jgi:hypothetical protein